MFQDETGKLQEKRQQLVHDQSMSMEKSWVVMMRETDKQLEG